MTPSEKISEFTPETDAELTDLVDIVKDYSGSWKNGVMSIHNFGSMLYTKPAAVDTLDDADTVTIYDVSTTSLKKTTIGGIKASPFTSLNITQGTITADSSALSITSTWNNAGVDFNGFKMEITDTLSGSGSTLMSLGLAGQTGHFRVFKPSVAGYNLVLGDGGTDEGASANYITFDTAWGDANFTSWGGQLALGGAGFSILALNGDLHLKQLESIAWSVSLNGIYDLALWRGAADTLSLSRLANPQTLWVVGTTDSDTAPVNYKRVAISHDGTDTNITAQNGGTLSGDNSGFIITPANTGHIILQSPLDADSKFDFFFQGGGNPRLQIKEVGNNTVVDWYCQTTKRRRFFYETAFGAGAGENTVGATVSIEDGSIATDKQALNITQIWNDGDGLTTTFTASKMDITDTFSKSDSLLADWKVGGSTQFSVSKSGVVQTKAIGAIGKDNLDQIIVKSGGSWNSFTERQGRNTAFGFVDGYPAIRTSTAALLVGINGGVHAVGTAHIGFGPSNNSKDVFLYRGGANTLALSNTTNAQTLWVVGSTDSNTSPVDYKRVAISHDGTDVNITAEVGGIYSGDASNIVLQPENGGYVKITNSPASSNNFLRAYSGAGENVDFHPRGILATTTNGYSIASPKNYFWLSADLAASDAFTFEARFSSGTIELTDTDGEQSYVAIKPQINQTLTAAYNALKIDVTETSTGDGSSGDGNNLIWAGVGGTSKFKVGFDGNGFAVAAGYKWFNTAQDSGVVTPGFGIAAQFSITGTVIAAFSSQHGLQVKNDRSISFSSNPSQTNADVSLWGAANTLSLANGTNAQTFQVYGTTDSATSPVNYERLSISNDGSNAIIDSQAGGTGVVTDLILRRGGSNRVVCTSLEVKAINLRPLATATYDIGSTSLEWRDAYIGTSIYIGPSTWGGRIYNNSGTPEFFNTKPSNDKGVKLRGTQFSGAELYVLGNAAGGHFTLIGNRANSDVAAGVSKIRGSDAWASATTNVDGGNLLLDGGIAKSGSTDGAVRICSEQGTFSVFDATPVAQQSHVADPAGGATVDSEARTAINNILTTLESFGFHATS